MSTLRVEWSVRIRVAGGRTQKALFVKPGPLDFSLKAAAQPREGFKQGSEG